MFCLSFRHLVNGLAVFCLLTGIAHIMTAAPSQPQSPSLNLPDRLPDHPRLMITPKVKARVAESLKSDALARRFFQRIQQGAYLVERTPPIQRQLKGDKRKRMLDTSRTALHNIVIMGMAHIFAPDPALRDRIISEMTAAVQFKDWHPSHFLDTSEMTLAIALGYDWLYDELSDTQRQIIRDGIIRLGLESALSHNGGLEWTNNWNQVRHGSLAAGALAVYEDSPELARRILQQARDNFRQGLQVYQGDGVYPEGPVYWSYGTSFSWVMAACLHSALDDDWGIAQSPGFAESFEYVKQVTTPTGLLFNYADCNRGPIDQPIHVWAGSMLDRPDYIRFGLASLDRYLAKPSARGSRLAPLALLWYEPVGDVQPTHGPTCYVGNGNKVRIAAIRSAWDEATASFIGIKGGSIQVNHGHMDIGSFIIEAEGVRWSEDLGMEREIYDRHDSWGTQQTAHRWSFLRANVHGHNTLSLGGTLQRVKGMNPIIRHGQSGNLQFAILDMSAAYKGQAKRAERGIALLADQSMVVMDELTGVADGLDLCWTMWTQARISLSDDGKQAVLKRKGKQLLVSLESDSAGRFEVADGTPPTEAENPNKGYSRLLVRLPAPVGNLKLVVRFRPPRAADKSVGLPQALADWP